MEKTPFQLRNEKLGKSVVSALLSRHFDACYCADSEEAIKEALARIPEGSIVSWGGSETIRKMGLTKAIHEGNYVVMDRDLANTPEEQQEIYRKVFSSDVYVTGTNALSEDGVLVNIDGNGNRVAAMTFGPKKVIVICGINKIVKTVEEAVSRARNTAAPINTQRFGLSTPCAETGECANCKSPDCICAYFSLIRISRPAGRISVIIVGENLGY